MDGNPQRSDRTSWIARERIAVGPAVIFWPIAGAITAGTIVFLLWLAGRPELTVAAEREADPAHAWGLLWHNGGPDVARAVAASLGGLAVLSVMVLGRRLLRSDAAGILAGALLLVDPAFLLYGHMGVAAGPTAGLALAAAAAFVQAEARWHWAGAVLLAAAALMDARTLGWAPALAALLLLRGHIYAAPKHLGVAVVQVLLIPVAAVGLWWAMAGATASCHIGRVPMWYLGEVPHLGGTLYALPGPVTWFAGLGALLLFCGMALGATAGRFRMHRLPGRIQLRLPEGMDRGHGRVLWLGLLALLAPSLLILLAMLCLAIAHGARELGRDAPWFGIATGLTVLGFAVVFSIRAWGIVTGDASMADAAEILDGLPWTESVPCSG